MSLRFVMGTSFVALVSTLSPSAYAFEQLCTLYNSCLETTAQVKTKPKPLDDSVVVPTSGPCDDLDSCSPDRSLYQIDLAEPAVISSTA
jgi:hypothetical protein